MTFIRKPFTAAAALAELGLGRQGTANEDGWPMRPLPAHIEVAASRYDNLDVSLDPRTGIYWAFMRAHGRPCFSTELMRDIEDMQGAIRRLFLDRGADKPLRYFVFGSRLPGVFNLGGDLALFADRIRAGDAATLRRYGRLAVQAIHRNHVALDLPIVTVALLQGDALGGGFECALSHDVIVAERGARIGLPEVLFNLFPGMGAYSFLSRRIGRVGAERLIMGGKIHTAEELHSLGIVDVLAEDGRGPEAVEDYVQQNSRRHNAHHAVYQARRRVDPITLDELYSVVDIWVGAAMNLTGADLKKMARLTSAQTRRAVAACSGQAAAMTV